ncbi:MAG: DUF418 domain-containing protein, partial [Halieaceae bacterium]
MGFYLQTQSKHYRVLHSLTRLSVLMVFGCLHALLYEGDILMLYAELGLLLLLLYRLPSRALLLLAVLLVLSFPVGHLFGGDRDDDLPFENAAEARAWLMDERAESPLVNGSLSEVLAYHSSHIPERFWADWQYPDSGFLVLACFLVGVVVMRSGWASLSQLSATRAGGFAAGLWLVGLGLMALERYWAWQVGYSPFDRTEASPGSLFLADLTYVGATAALAAGWFFSAKWWVTSRRLSVVRAYVASAGRMSLSAYLSQTLIFTTVFYGYGLDVAYFWGPTQVVLLSVVIYAGQLLLCHWWQARYRRGPAEWLWRSLTLWRWEPLRSGQ